MELVYLGCVNLASIRCCNHTLTIAQKQHYTFQYLYSLIIFHYLKICYLVTPGKVFIFDQMKLRG